MSYLVLPRADVSRHLSALPLFDLIKEGLRAHSPGAGAAEQGRVRFPTPEVPAYAKLGEGTLPGESGPCEIVSLFGPDDVLLALLDAGPLRSLSSAIACAVAADVLARPDATRVALIGTGAHAGAQLKSLRLVRSLQHVRVFDLDLERMAAFATRMYQALALPVRMADSVEEAVSDADLVLAITDAIEPFVFPGMVLPGCHVTSIGMNVSGHRELSANLIRQSSFFCDDRARAGELLTAMGLGPEAIAAELGAVLAGQHPGRRSRDEITLHAAFGLEHQVLAAAWLVYESAREDPSVARG
jgi:ornithine cyclodeaminase/alanine dehydrogenase-like protein (mu-crystallin family)